VCPAYISIPVVALEKMAPNMEINQGKISFQILSLTPGQGSHIRSPNQNGELNVFRAKQLKT
jgi:hypothetical protein